MKMDKKKTCGSITKEKARIIINSRKHNPDAVKGVV